jgi:hypothetical protein
MKTEATKPSEMLVDVALHPKKTAVVFNAISTECPCRITYTEPVVNINTMSLYFEMEVVQFSLETERVSMAVTF